jgi:hypothetical protein
MPCPSHYDWCDHSYSMLWCVQIMQILNWANPSTPLSIHRPVDPKHLPQHPVLKQPHPMFLPQRERPSFTLIQNNTQNNSSFYFNVCVSGKQTGGKKRFYTQQ